MNDFIAAADRALLGRHRLDSFEALWALQLEAVDMPNTERGGWSSVYRLELEGQAFYLKKQRNHLTRSLCRPRGEPTFARELRNIRHYRRLGIPTLEAAFYAERRQADGHCAVLLTRALDGWQDLASHLPDWSARPPAERRQIVQACGALARRLHAAGQVHGCFYPKHIFLREAADGFDACLIDLEKTRRLWLGRRDRIKDIEPLLRRTGEHWQADDRQQFLCAYLAGEQPLAQWQRWLDVRRQHKAARP